MQYTGNLYSASEKAQRGAKGLHCGSAALPGGLVEISIVLGGGDGVCILEALWGQAGTHAVHLTAKAALWTTLLEKKYINIFNNV